MLLIKWIRNYYWKYTNFVMFCCSKGFSEGILQCTRAVAPTKAYKNCGTVRFEATKCLNLLCFDNGSVILSTVIVIWRWLFFLCSMGYVISTAIFLNLLVTFFSQQLLNQAMEVQTSPKVFKDLWWSIARSIITTYKLSFLNIK